MMMSRYAVLGLVLFFALGASGCRDMYLSDDIDIDFNWTPIEGRGDTLHTPYVVGTEVVISANDNLDSSDNELGWTMTSTDEGVLRIDSVWDGRAQCVAVGAGTAEIRVHDNDGEHIYSGDIEVREPTRAELFAHGPLIIGWNSDEALVEGPIRILAGGMGTFLIRYYDGDDRLYGNGVLEARAADDSQDIGLEARQSYLSENREWLSISPHIPGVYDVELFAGDIPVGQGVVEAVDVDEIDQIILLGQSEIWAQDDDWLTVLAQAYDSSGNPIYGAEYIWDIDGELDTEMGDLYRYEYEDDRSVHLSADFYGLRDEIEIHSSGGYVDSTNNIGCSATGSSPSGAAPFLMLLAVVAFRHRR